MFSTHPNPLTTTRVSFSRGSKKSTLSSFWHESSHRSQIRDDIYCFTMGTTQTWFEDGGRFLNRPSRPFLLKSRDKKTSRP